MKRSWSSLLLVATVQAACRGSTAASTTATTGAPTATATPSVEGEVIVSGGEVMRAALEEATDLVFEVSVPTS